MTNYIQASELPNDKDINSDENAEQKSTFKRHASVTSIISSSEKSNHSEDLVEPIGIIETRSSGNISCAVYLSYFFTGGKKCKILFFIFICIITQALTSFGDFWITYW